MSHNLAALLAVNLVGRDAPKNTDDPVFAEQLSVNDGQVLEILSEVTLAEFPTALAAVNCAVEVQRARSQSADSVKAIRFAINHLSDDRNGSTLRPEETGDIVKLLDLAEAGGICLGRTVYDAVRGHLSLRYDTQMDVKEWCYTCVPFRQNSHKINLVKDSAVRVSAAVLADDQRSDSNQQANLLLRAFRALFRPSAPRVQLTDEVHPAPDD